MIRRYRVFRAMAFPASVALEMARSSYEWAPYELLFYKNVPYIEQLCRLHFGLGLSMAEIRGVSA